MTVQTLSSPLQKKTINYQPNVHRASLSTSASPENKQINAPENRQIENMP